MGYLDSELVLAAAQAATDHTTDTPSTNVYDSGLTNADIALTSENLWIQAYVNTAATSGGAGTMQAVLQDSADNVTFVDVLAGPVLALAALIVGAALLRVQPPAGIRRYFRIAWRIGTADLTAGKFDAYVSNTVQLNGAKPSGFSVA